MCICIDCQKLKASALGCGKRFRAGDGESLVESGRFSTDYFFAAADLKIFTRPDAKKYGAGSEKICLIGKKTPTPTAPLFYVVRLVPALPPSPSARLRLGWKIKRKIPHTPTCPALIVQTHQKRTIKEAGQKCLTYAFSLSLRACASWSACLKAIGLDIDGVSIWLAPVP